MPEPKLYDDVLMDHIRNARNYTALADADRTACGANPLCGDDVTVYVKFDNERLERIAFQCTCCGISMASGSIMTETMAGRSTAEALAGIRAFADLLSSAGPDTGAIGEDARYAVLDTVRRFPARLRCALLPWITLEAALQGRREASFSRER
jgi:nitrogen fixation NifU-like protein